MAAVAAANTVHWTVPHNLLRNPEAQAHLGQRTTSVSILAPADKKTHTDEPHLNMEVTNSQVSERTPTQTQGMVTVFMNWLNWW